MRMRHIVLSCVACPFVQYICTLPRKRHDFQKEKIMNIKCVFWFYLQVLFETFLILRRIERDKNKNVYSYLCKVAIILERF
jgi:uncharacterized membrane protein YozB (DUF420 family)